MLKRYAGKFVMRAALLASAVGLSFAATPVLAQDYRVYDNPPPDQVSYRGDAPEEVDVYAPRHRNERSAIGAPIETSSLSQPGSI